MYVASQFHNLILGSAHLNIELPHDLTLVQSVSKDFTQVNIDFIKADTTAERAP